MREKVYEHLISRKSHHETTVGQNEPIDLKQQDGLLLCRWRLAPEKPSDVVESPHSRNDGPNVVAPDYKTKFESIVGPSELRWGLGQVFVDLCFGPSGKSRRHVVYVNERGADHELQKVECCEQE